MIQDINPLEVLNKRVLDFLPKHFVRTCIGEVDAREIKTWIRSNLKGRYCVVSYPTINENTGRLRHAKFVGFEDPKELTYFMLACPYKRRD